MIVLKFGGTSVGDRERVRESASIIEAQPQPRAVVVSAASGVTNLLLEAARAAAAGEETARAEAVAKIQDKHWNVVAGIQDDNERAATIAELDQLHNALNDALASVAEQGSLSNQDSDRIVSTGEKAMSIMMAATLRSRGTDAVHIFATRVIATDNHYGSARPDRARTREQAAAVVRPLLNAGKTVVMTGFIGAAPDGSTTTLGRGGSDYSATLLGASLDADEVQIWTDVPGVLSADPRKVKDARVVSHISYEEAQELAHFGAKVLHPRTIRPAVSRNVPVRILSTFLPTAPGTLVTPLAAGQHLKAVTAMSGLTLLTIDVPELEDFSGAAAAVFRTLYEEQIEVVLAAQASSRRRMTYLIDTLSGGGCAQMKRRILEALRGFDAEIGCVEDVAVVAAVGHGAAEQPGYLSRLLTVLERSDIPVLASSQQMSNVALVVAVPAGHADQAVSAIHTAFIRPQPINGRGRRPRRSELMAESLRVG